MKKKKNNTPTDSELEILHVLWENGPSTVRFVNDHLNKKKEVGYTTTLKFMQIMTDKLLVRRNTESRTHIYEALVSESDTQSKLLTGFLESTFGGSAMKLVMQALGSHKASKQELDELKELINNIEKNQK